MPSRGVQDYEDIKKKRTEERKQQQDKAKKWCQLAGLTIVELVLCFCCLALAYAINQTIHWHLNIKFLMLPKVPIIVAAAYFLLVVVDLLSWITLRPITYFAWIAASTSAFLMFMVYAGVCVFNKKSILGILGIVLGVITSLVFLIDTICCLISLKRFPVPHWTLKRKFDKFDECVCTGDYDPEAEKEIDRPLLCRCGDSWGEPCTCDEPDTTCRCGAEQMDQPPCPCCECSTQALVQDQDGTTVYGSEFDDFPRKSIVTTASGRDYLADEDPVDPRKSTFTQVSILPSIPPEVWCTDAPASAAMAPPPRKSVLSQRTVGTADKPGASYVSRKSTMSQRTVTLDGSADPRKSTVSRKSDYQAQKSHSNLSSGTGKRSRSEMPTYSVYTATVDQNVQSSLDFPSHPIMKLKGFGDDGQPHRTKSVNLSGDAPMLCNCDTYSTDEEYEVGGVGDFSRPKVIYRDCPARKRGSDKDVCRFPTYTSTDCLPNQELSLSRLLSEDYLPGQASSSTKNVSVTAKIRDRRATACPGAVLRSSPCERLRPRSESSSRTIIRNVSTTVRPVRILSSVMEASHESGSRSQTDVDRRRSDTFPSECTITINK